MRKQVTGRYQSSDRLTYAFENDNHPRIFRLHFWTTWCLYTYVVVVSCQFGCIQDGGKPAPTNSQNEDKRQEKYALGTVLKFCVWYRNCTPTLFIFLTLKRIFVLRPFAPSRRRKWHSIVCSDIFVKVLVTFRFVSWKYRTTHTYILT